MSKTKKTPSVPALLFGLVFAFVVGGFVFKICWNVSLPNLFNLNRITFLNALILTNLLTMIRGGYKEFILNLIESIENATIKKEKSGLNALIYAVSVFVIVISMCIFMVCGFKYSWNTIIPNLFNIEFTQINLIQSCALVYILNDIIGHIGSSDNNEEED